MDILPDTRVADIATHNPATIRIFQRFGVDFCCGGRRSLSEVCTERQVTFDDLRTALASAEKSPTTELPGEEATLSELIRFIVHRYHADLRQELPRLGEMAAKVLEVHGAKHPDLLPALESTFRGLREELNSHMAKEEQILFPYIEKLEDLAANHRTLRGSPFGTILAPIGTMEHEHEDAARALALMRQLTSAYTPPANACNTFRGLYHGLAELEKALHEHIHLENNLLFPRAVRLEQELSGSDAR